MATDTAARKKKPTGITIRSRADGTNGYQYKWRYGGTRDGAWQSVTLDSLGDAQRLQSAVVLRKRCIYDTDPSILNRSIITGIEPSDHTQANEGPTFGQVMDEWLAQHEGRSSTVRTHKGHKRQLSTWLDRPIRSLTGDDARELRTEIAGRGLKPRSILITAKAACRYAVKRGIREGSPFDTVPIPRPDLAKRREELLTTEDIALAIAYSKTEDMKLMIEAAYETGLREGELCALRPEHVFVQRGQAYLLVRQTATRNDKSGWSYGNPKTENGTRDVSITLELAARLKAHGNAKWIFPNRSGGMLSPATVQSRWRRMRERAVPAGFSKPRGRFHDIRHLYATENMEVNGDDDTGVSLELGHSTVQITKDMYVHDRRSQERMRKRHAAREAAAREAAAEKGRHLSVAS